MADSKFNVGDVVQLKSGSQTMTITARWHGDNHRWLYSCAWFFGQNLCNGFFDEPVLAKTAEPA